MCYIVRLILPSGTTSNCKGGVNMSKCAKSLVFLGPESEVCHFSLPSVDPVILVLHLKRLLQRTENIMPAGYQEWLTLHPRIKTTVP